MTYALRIADVLSESMTALGMNARQLQEASGVPDSTINSYLRAKSENPSPDNLRALETALGLGEGFFAKLRRECLAEAEREALLLAQAHDRELLEEMGALNREAMLEMLAAYKTYSDEQLAAFYDRSRKQNAAVVEQCRVHEAEYRAHCDEVLAAERTKFEQIKAQDERSKAYMRALVRNLSVLCCLLAIYALYAFSVFDIADHTRGLARGERAVHIPHLLLIIALGYVALSTAKHLFLRIRARK